MRTLVIGDIHGNLDALNVVLKKAKFNIETDRIICIGDYIDGWGESFEVVRTLLEIKNQSKLQNIFLLGNHDKWFLDVLSNDFENFRNEDYIKSKYSQWYLQGGKSTYESYLKYDDEFIMIHKEHFFDELKYYYEDQNKLYIHAGFDIKIGFDETMKQKREELLWDRSLHSESVQLWHIDNNLRMKGNLTNRSQIGKYDKIYIGHTPTTLIGFDKPKYMANVINVDQGCKRKGVLTIWIDETDEFYQNK
ncbi:MAG: metallophosphoesterase [Crocinitomicaceae bacterium]